MVQLSTCKVLGINYLRWNCGLSYRFQSKLGGGRKGNLAQEQTTRPNKKRAATSPKVASRCQLPASAVEQVVEPKRFHDKRSHCIKAVSHRRGSTRVELPRHESHRQGSPRCYW